MEDREIDLRRMILSLRNLLLVYASGLAVLIIYIFMLSYGVRLLLGLVSPLKEIAMISYGSALTVTWLYSWWRAIKAIRNKLLGIGGSGATSR